MLKPHHFSFKCPLQISDLEKTENGHYCAKCSKDIYDLSDCSIEEIIELQRRKGSICGFVRAVSVTSLVGLAACSKSESTNHNDGDANGSKPPQQQTLPVNNGRELMGEICIPEDKTPKPEQVEPEQAPKKDETTVATDGEQPQNPEKPEVIEIKPPNGPVIMGLICPPEQLKPQEPKPLDPNREGSPG